MEHTDIRRNFALNLPRHVFPHVDNISNWQIMRVLTTIITIKVKERKLTMKKYVCDVCGWVYDPAVGDPDNGIAPGTAFEDLPDDWVCPLCGVGKDEFSPVEE